MWKKKRDCVKIWNQLAGRKKTELKPWARTKQNAENDEGKCGAGKKTSDVALGESAGLMGQKNLETQSGAT